jgi:hypothetical protein
VSANARHWLAEAKKKKEKEEKKALEKQMLKMLEAGLGGTLTGKAKKKAEEDKVRRRLLPGLTRALACVRRRPRRSARSARPRSSTRRTLPCPSPLWSKCSAWRARPR